jgi:cAMP-dependent protein kinase regulator
MREDAKLDRLAAIPLFAGTDRKQLERVARLCTEVRVPSGRTLCTEGEPGQEFFVVEEGEAAVTVGGSPVATLRAGDFFGELALLDGQARAATVTSTTEMQVLVLTASEFDGALQADPMIAVRMLPAIGARLRAKAQAPQERPPVV